MPSRLALLACLLCAAPAPGAGKPPVYLWFEPEWFEGVEGSFAYWPGPAASKPTGSWAVAGPGISPEWTQGGESEWNSMGGPAAETHARCHRDFAVPRSGPYRLWVRYVDHRRQTQPFTVTLEQNGRPAASAEMGVHPVVPVNDEYQLYWGFSFGWDSVPLRLAAGPARLLFTIDKPGQAWRQVDAVLLTDDLHYTPVAREKPPFGYLGTIDLSPPRGGTWRGSGTGLTPEDRRRRRPRLGGQDFTMWTGIDTDPKWWTAQKLDTLSLYDVLFEFDPPADIKKQFHHQFAGHKDVPIMSWPRLRPGLYLGSTPDLSSASPVRKWLERTRTPFYILTNYANPQYTAKTGPATFAALTGPLADQFLGYIHGETVGSPGVGAAAKPLAKTRREHVDALAAQLLQQQAVAWTAVFKTPVPEAHWAKGIPCLSADSTALAHVFHEAGSRVVGYEEDATNVHVPMRIAFQRGAARQYGGAWINYASGNFGDACNYFTQQPVVPRGAPAWFHSKYAITDGVSTAWYRRLYYLNYLGGASAIYWEQNLTNQFILPGPGTHPVQLSPFGRATEDFQAFADRLPDRGEPLTPVALLLSYGHGYERVNNSCKMLNAFREDKNDLELRELFNVCWHPSGVLEGLPAAPDVQSMPGGTYGNIFDVLVDRPDRARALFDYPVVWAAGDVRLTGTMLPVVQEYVHEGGTLVLNVESARTLPADLLGVRLSGKSARAESWSPEGESPRPTTPYDVALVELAGAQVLARAEGATPLIIRHRVGAGAVILSLVPHLIGLDERAHPALPFLMNGLTAGLLPVEVRLPGGRRPHGEVMYQVNRTKDGYLVMLANSRGIDKTQSGVARVDRRAYADVVLGTSLRVKSARECTGPTDLTRRASNGRTEIPLRVHPGDVQVVYLLTQ